MTRSLLLGVDGGGTKTEFVLIDREGGIAARHGESGAYYLQIGVEGLRDVIRRGLKVVLNQLAVSGDAVEHAFFGLPAYGEDSTVQPLLDSLPADLLGHRRYRCGNDMVCTWAGSLAGEDGIGIVAGTGSIAYGERAGRTARAGGWGEIFGDEGSAHWIATRGLNAFSRMSDGRSPKGPLHALLVQELGLADDLDLCAYLTSDGGTTRERIAAFCPLVARAADKGDTEAVAIFSSAAMALAELADALRAALKFQPGDPVPVSYSGGVFRTGELILAPLRRALSTMSSDFDLRPPLLPPSVGAALYAARDCGRPLGTDAIARLRAASAPSTDRRSTPNR
jgi:N-acetylglucosamine kinase-like BadF-type ATPase